MSFPTSVLVPAPQGLGELQSVIDPALRGVRSAPRLLDSDREPGDDSIRFGTHRHHRDYVWKASTP
jgi:hypothetical protein